MSKGFGSDNHSPVHPQILKAIIDCNQNHAPSYGTDELSHAFQKKIKSYFGPDTESFLVFNGTAANVLCLKAMLQSHESVLCSDVSHLNVDECGAPEALVGCKLIPVPSNEGKVSLSDLKKRLIRRGDQHFSQVKAVSLTQPTELGTCYSLKELKEISNWCKEQSLYLHIDGARLCNAAVYLNCGLKELITDTGVDILSFGGTKNGFLFGEAVVVLNPKLKSNMKYDRKQMAQLPSKTRYLAASFLAYLENDLWKEIATHSCLMAEKLYQGLSMIPSIKITAARQSNAVFVQIPQDAIKTLRQSYFFYVWNEETFECRLMTSWDTTETEILDFCQKLRSTLK